MSSINSVNNVDPGDSYLISSLTDVDLDDDDDDLTAGGLDQIIARLQAKIAEMQEKLAAIQRQEGEIQTRIDALNGKIADLRNSLSTLDGKDLRDAQRELIADTARVNKLQRKLNGLDDADDRVTSKLDYLVEKLSKVEAGGSIGGDMAGGGGFSGG